MIEQRKPWSKPTNQQSSVYGRLVKIPAILFFLLCLSFRVTVQFRTAFQLNVEQMDGVDLSLPLEVRAPSKIRLSPKWIQRKQKIEARNTQQSKIAFTSGDAVDRLNKHIASATMNYKQDENGQERNQTRRYERNRPFRGIRSMPHGQLNNTVSYPADEDDTLDKSGQKRNQTRRYKRNRPFRGIGSIPRGQVDDSVFDYADEDDTLELEVVTTSLTERKRKIALKKQKTAWTGQKQKKRKTRVIFGIMSYDSKSEKKRRALIRRTFLSYFKDLKDHMNRTLVSEEEYNKKKHWICSLNDLDHGRLEHPDKCRMAYAFVQGANPNGTTMLLNFNESYPLSLRPEKLGYKQGEKDISDSVYLNIQENGKFGKSPTWFRYAIDVLERHGWMNDFDYIFKSDADNLIYTPNFFRFLDKKLARKKAIRVYGGRPLNYEGCGGDSHDHCSKMVGPLFMAGGCYFLSTDLAKFISDETTFDHQAVKLPHEDMTSGNFVYSHPKEITLVKEPRKKFVIRTHPVKKDIAFNHRWNKMLREEEVRLLKGQTY